MRDPLTSPRAQDTTTWSDRDRFVYGRAWLDWLFDTIGSRDTFAVTRTHVDIELAAGSAVRVRPGARVTVDRVRRPSTLTLIPRSTS